jgi:predicted RNA binding protein YcfA (HicA-like mRNA interferase family)
VTVQEAIQILESHGWHEARSEERLRQFRHKTKPGTLTVAGRLDLDVPPGVLKNILLDAKMEGDD